MELRYYQQESVNAIWKYINDTPDGHPVIDLPTGSGKSLVLAQLAINVHGWGGRSIILAHRRELLVQNAEKIASLAPSVPVGVYSAGLNSRDTGESCTVAGIQSVYRRAKEFGPLNVIIVDECHLIPPDGDGMYQQFIRDAIEINPKVKIIGLTATPYRMKTGYVYGEGQIFDACCYTAGIKDLINKNFLSPLTCKATVHEQAAEGVSTRGGEFVPGALDDYMAEEERVKNACYEIVAKTHERKSTLIFTAGRKHGKAVYEQLKGTVVQAAYLDGETPSDERKNTLKLFKEGWISHLVNIDVLTTGFDAPNIDCICLLRPTLSPGLYAQMVGRGLRKSPGKLDCLVLDFGANVKRHGPIDKMRIEKKKAGKKGTAVTKTCPDCLEIVHAGRSRCPQCDYEFPSREAKHDSVAGNDAILSGAPTIEVFDVERTTYTLHEKANSDVPTMKVTYKVSMFKEYSEWVCPEHVGFARNKALKWWSGRSLQKMPSRVELCLQVAHAGGLAKPLTVTVKQPDEYNKYPQIMTVGLDAIPDPAESTRDIWIGEFDECFGLENFDMEIEE